MNCYDFISYSSYDVIIMTTTIIIVVVIQFAPATIPANSVCLATFKRTTRAFLEIERSWGQGQKKRKLS